MKRKPLPDVICLPHGSAANWRPPLTRRRIAAIGGGLAILRSGDRVRIDLNKRTADILISKEEYDQRRAELQANGGYKYPRSQSPWQDIQRKLVGGLAEGMVLKPAVKYKRIVRTYGTPRDNH